MPRKRLINQRLAAMFLLGCVLFNYPMLAAFNLASPIFGIPANVVWLFGSWLLVIVLIALIVERPASGRKDRHAP